MDAEEFTGDTVVVPGSLRVFREWNLDQQDSKAEISSLAAGSRWGNSMTAFCKTEQTHWFCYNSDDLCDICVANISHEAPAVPCTCGIYGYYVPTVSGIDDYLYGYESVYGTVRVSGRVILGTRGVRAQYAEIESFYIGDGLQVTTQKSLELAGWRLSLAFPSVPVYTDYDAWLVGYPPEDVTMLL